MQSELISPHARLTPALLRRPPAPAEKPTPVLQAVWARHEEDLRAAQQLRWRVFAEEMGARLRPPPGTPIERSWGPAWTPATTRSPVGLIRPW